MNKLMPHGDWFGKNLGIAMEDEESGQLTLTFSMLEITETSLSGDFDSRCPICSNEENTLKPAKAAMAGYGISLNNDSTTFLEIPSLSRRSLRAMRCTREERESALPSEAERMSTT